MSSPLSIIRKSLLFILPLLCFTIYGQETWNLYKESPNNLVPIQLEITNDGTLFVLSDQGNIHYRNVDNEEWSSIDEVYAFWNHNNIGVNPTNNTLFVGTQGQGITYTSDYGETWGQEYFFTSPSSGFHANVNAIGNHPDGDYVIINGGSNPSTGNIMIYKSPNNGETWVPIIAPAGFLKFYFMNNGDIIASTDQQGIYKSSNNGNSWESTGFDGLKIADFAEDNSGNLYAAVQESTSSDETGIYKSVDLGISWSIMNNGLTSPIANCITYDPIQNRLVCGTNEGIYYLEGDTWSSMIDNLDNSPVNDITTKDGFLFLGNKNFGVNSKESGASMWTDYNQGLNGNVTAYEFLNSTAFTGFDRSHIFSVNSNPANDWENFNLSAISTEIDRTIEINNNNDDLFILDFDDLFRSTDGGNSFENITPDIPLAPFAFYHFFDKLIIGENDELFLYQRFDVRVYHSIDNGSTWQEFVNLDIMPELGSMVDLTVNSEGQYYMYLLDINGSDFLKFSEDGIDWTEVDLSDFPSSFGGAGVDLHTLANDQSILMLNRQPYFLDGITLTPMTLPYEISDPNVNSELNSNNENHIYISQQATFGSLDQSGIWRTTNFGVSWENIGFPDNEVSEESFGIKIKFNQNDIPFCLSTGPTASIIHNDKKLYYYGRSGLPTDIQSIAEQSSLLAYPNPASTNDIVRLKNEFIDLNSTILIVDENGRNVSTNWKTTNGEALIEFDHVSPGQYFVKVINDNVTSNFGSIVIE